MKKSLVLAAVAVCLLLGACTGQCPSRCNQWGWYRPCDLIEGQGGCASFHPSTMADPCRCDPCGYRAGQVVSREWAYPVQPCAAPEAAAAAAPAQPVEPMPAPPAPAPDAP